MTISPIQMNIFSIKKTCIYDYIQITYKKIRLFLLLWIAMENEGKIDRYLTLALQQVTLGPIKELLKVFWTCTTRGSLFKRSIGFNLSILTGRGIRTCTYCTIKQAHHIGKGFTVSRRNTNSDHISFLQSSLGDRML